MTWTFALISLVAIYLLRFFTNLNSYLFIAIASIFFMIISVSFAHILTLNNYLIEKTCLLCGEDADHARNIA
jgi:hypothetical protein